MRPLVQEARVLTPPCSSSEKSGTPSSSGTKRRGRGSFLYDKSVLYSDHCGSERDLDDKGSDPRGGSKGHVDEQENKDGNLFRMTSLLCLVSLLMMSELNSCSFVRFCSCQTIWDTARPCSLRLST